MIEKNTSQEICQKLFRLNDKNNLDYELRNKEWISLKSIVKEIDDMIESVELAGYDNPVDEAYHNALLNVKKLIKGDE